VLHNEARELLVEGYEKSRDAAGIAQAYSVSIQTVYRLVRQKRETGSVALRTSQRERKPILTAEDKENMNLPGKLAGHGRLLLFFERGRVRVMCTLGIPQNRRFCIFGALLLFYAS